MSKVRIIIGQLGSPKSPAVSDVRSYLKEFLGDPRVVDINPLAWKLILNLFVLPFRPARSARLYSRIWDEKRGFPLIYITESFAKKMADYLAPRNIEVNHVFLLSSPRIADVWDEYEKLGDEKNKFLIVPMFPQYSESTIGSVMDVWNEELKKRVKIPQYEFMTDFHRSRAFIDNSITRINSWLADQKQRGIEIDALMITFHGIPKRRVIYKKDRYHRDCYETYWLIREGINDFPRDKIHITFQSRFGSEEWLGPYTDEYAVDLVENHGVKRIACYCPSFVADCLETTDEIGTELNEEVKEHGGEALLIPCLNDDDQWVRDFADYCVAATEGQKKQEEQEYTVPEEAYAEMPEVVMEKPPLSPFAKNTIKIVFLTLFLDLVGFSIIFPLFPALAKHYLQVNADNYFLKLIFESATFFLGSAQGSGLVDKTQAVVLFGGVLGALYSFLQFLAAPIWGIISDRIGRKPVLLISLIGIAVSYVMWFFSGSFTLLIAARFVGGIMAGNISTATAVVADVTDAKNRSKGMAFIGIAFAFGFIIGPAMGGILSMIDLTKSFPALENWGVNPFSMPALVAFVLTVFNIVWIIRKFQETLPEEKRGHGELDRTFNPIKLFAPLPYPGVNLTNVGHFLFLAAFSGMEFTLTFLAVERLSYSSMDNAYMFIFIGFIIAFVQGGVVRRKAADVGEKKMALMGLVSILPGLVLIGMAQSSWLLYGGLFFLAVGAAMAIPCLTSLVSLYTPPEQQGKSVGIFRSLGAFARVVGPLLAAWSYWHFGSSTPYYFGAAFLLIPILMVAALPKPGVQKSETA